MREKLKALMQGLQQRGQEYAGPGTIRGHNNVGVDENPMQFSSDWIIMMYPMPFSFHLFILLCPRVPFFAVRDNILYSLKRQFPPHNTCNIRSFCES